MTNYKPGEVLLCPHCGKQPDYDGTPAEDFVIPGRDGERSRADTDCGLCDGKFSAVRNGDTITVTAE